MSDLGFDNMIKWQVKATLVVLDKPNAYEGDVEMFISTPNTVKDTDLKALLRKTFQDVEVKYYYSYHRKEE